MRVPLLVLAIVFVGVGVFVDNRAYIVVGTELNEKGLCGPGRCSTGSDSKEPTAWSRSLSRISCLVLLDPALASGPILTTVTDMCGFFLVLSFATAALPSLGN
jgi:hypothetical protein